MLGILVLCVATVKDDVAGAAQSLDDAQNRVLRELNLPSVVDALDAPIGLPPSLLRKAEEVRVSQGPERIEQEFDDVQMLASRAQRILDDVSRYPAEHCTRLIITGHGYP